MFPSWGSYGAHPPQNFGGPAPRKQHLAGQAAPAGGSLFSSLQEQHLQQMQQLQMLHQKQLESVLHHNSAAGPYGSGGGGATGFSAPPWQSEPPGHVDNVFDGAPAFYKQDEAQAQPTRGQDQPRPPGPQPTGGKPNPPPPELPSPGGPQSKDGAKSKEEQQQYWYKQHLQNLQKLKHEGIRQNQAGGDAPPLPSEPPKSAPPPPPPKEEPPVPPPPPEDPDLPKDPEEVARLQQLQAAAAQWQHVQQQRAGLQYQALMQQHEKLQQILEKYQQFIQQPANLQSMSNEMQLRHYETQQQQFNKMYQDWEHTFQLWYDQFQTYPHKDQLQDYELQWKQWQEQMNATHTHLQERVATLRTMVPYPSSQYSGGMMDQYSQYPGQDFAVGLQGSVSQGQMSQGAMPHRPMSQGSPSQGSMFQGQISQGSMPQGQMSHGQMSQGSLPQGPMSQSSMPQGQMPQGQMSQGPTPQGPMSQGSMFQGQMSQGSMPQGQMSQGSMPQGQMSQGSMSQGQMSQGSMPQGQMSQGSMSHGQMSQGSLPQGQMAQGSMPQGQMAHGQMSQGPMSQGPRVQGPRPGFGQPPEQQGGPAVRGGVPSHMGERQIGPGHYGPRGLRPDGPRGGTPRFDQQRFDGPPRFERPPFDQNPRGFAPRFGQPPRFDQPPRQPGPQNRFERPPGPQPRPPVPNQHPSTPNQRPPAPNQRPPAPNQRLPAPSQRLPAPNQRLPAPRLPTPQQQPPHGPKTEATVTPATNALSKAPAGPGLAGAKKENDPTPSKPESMADDSLDGTTGFFLPSDPIPQTSHAKDDGANATKAPGNSKPNITATSPVTPKNTAPAQANLKPGGPVANSHGAQNTAKLPEGKPPPKPPGQPQPNSEPPKPALTVARGRGRGHPPPLSSPQMRGRGCGQPPGRGGFNNFPPPEETEDMAFDYAEQQNDGMGPQEEQDEYYWQDPSYEEPAGDEAEALQEQELWVPEEHHFPVEDDYYEESAAGGPMMGRGRFPQRRGGPPLPRGGPYMGRGGPPMGRGGPSMGPYMGRGGPPMGRGGPPMGRGGPPMGRGGPPMGRGGPPMGRGGPPMGRGGPPMGRGGPPMGRGGPMGMGGPMGRGEPMERQWEDPESAEWGEEEPYWEDWRPPMRGMRPPFPPGRGRPPRAHPGMHPGRGRPPFPPHGQMDHGPLGPPADPEGMDMEPMMDPMMHPMHRGHDPRGRPMRHDVGRGRMLPPLEMREPMEEPPYDEDMEKESEWHRPPQHGRGPPPAPHEMMDREPARGGGPQMGGGGRGMQHSPGAPHEKYEEGRREAIVEDYGHGESRYGWRPPPRDYPPSEYDHERHYHDGDWERERPTPARDFSPRVPPPERFREGSWPEERDRPRPYPYDEPERPRGELRIRDYREEPAYRREEPPRPEWERAARPPPPPLPERTYPPEYERPRPHYDPRGEPAAAMDAMATPQPATPLGAHPEAPPDPGAQGGAAAGVLALSQRQHEIILKAAQELKFIREMQEGVTEPQPPAPEVPPELPAGLLGLEIPPEVRNALKGMVASAQPVVSEPPAWDSMPHAAGYHPPPAATPAPVVLPKTVDYGHGHEPGTTVERISYGERIVLRPDPQPADRAYEKEPLGIREPYGRDPYYDRRPDPYPERRDYVRDRESYRDKPPPDYERERFDRDRYPPREDRPPFGGPPPRPSYRDREPREDSAGRDREDPYPRPGYDRPPYERTPLECGAPERYGHRSSPYGERRGFPEERGPGPASSLPPPPQPPPQRTEKKPETKNVDDLLKPPGRTSRPERIVIIMRGLPGSGKSHVAKLIRDKEVECGGAPPRVLVLDDYFMTEVEKVEKDPDTGRRVKNKVLEYEYEPEMEDTYRSSLLKTFKKTLDDGFFPFIIMDTINDRVKHFEQFWSAAKTKGFEVYLAEITADNQTCVKRNVHGRTLKDIAKMASNWEPSPRHMVRLDVRSLLQDAAIEEVEMEDFNPGDEAKEMKREEEEEGDMGYIPKSKWEMDTSEAKLDKLDGIVCGGKRKRDGVAGMEDFLQLPDDYATRLSQPGKKRVRWADLEEQKEADRKRAIGFVVGQTDWERITDESGQLAQKALNRTKFF